MENLKEKYELVVNGACPSCCFEDKESGGCSLSGWDMNKFKLSLNREVGDCCDVINGCYSLKELEDDKMKTAIQLIAEERERQISNEGYTPEHDDKEHSCGELAMAAMCYCMDPDWRPKELAPLGWPWLGGKNDGFKPTPDNRIKELTKAGALIVAEIERLQRLGICDYNNELQCKYKDSCGHYPCILTDCPEFEPLKVDKV